LLRYNKGMLFMEKKVISTDKAAAAIGPYSQGMLAGGMIFTSGQIPISAENGDIVGTNISEQTEQAIKNLAAVLAAAGSDFENVVKTTCFISDMNNFAEFNKVYSKYFSANKPARSCVEVARLPKDVLVEIEAVAITRQ